MGGYDERGFGGVQGVDGWIDEAWKGFRTRMADWLAEDDAGEGRARFDLGQDDPAAPVVTVIAQDDRLLVWVEVFVEGEPDPTRASPDVQLSPRGAALLVDLGFGIDQVGEPTLVAEVHEVDRVAHAVTVVLRDVYGVLAPAFLDLEEEGERTISILAPTPSGDPEPEAPDLPAVVRPESAKDLQEVVEAVMRRRVSHPLRVGPGGNVSMVDEEGGRAVVAARGAHLVEVWTLVASEVRFKAAHRAIDALSRNHRHVRFFLDRDNLVAAVSVPADPLVVEHLDDAVTAVMELASRLSQLDEQLKRRRYPKQEPPTPTLLDPTLAALVASAGRVPFDDYVDVLADVVDGDHARAVEWLETARAARSRASEAMQAADGHLRAVHGRDWRHWRKTVSALKVVRDGATGPAADRSAS